MKQIKAILRLYYYNGFTIIFHIIYHQIIFYSLHYNEN
jgi:hypothetical protein